MSIADQDRQKYNPELQKRSLERRKEKQEDFDNFVTRLKEYSKSDKPGSFPPFPSHALVTINVAATVTVLTWNSMGCVGARSRAAAEARHTEGTRPEKRGGGRGGGEKGGDAEFAEVGSWMCESMSELPYVLYYLFTSLELLAQIMMV